MKFIQNFLTSESDILKPKGKLKIVRDHIVKNGVMYTMTTRIMNSVQQLFRTIDFHNFSYFLFHVFI